MKLIIYFLTVVSLETFLPMLDCPTIVAIGTEDPYSSPSYLDYPKSLVAEKGNFTFKCVNGA